MTWMLSGFLACFVFSGSYFTSHFRLYKTSQVIKLMMCASAGSLQGLCRI